jgi:hypothetical protein
MDTVIVKTKLLVSSRIRIQVVQSVVSHYSYLSSRVCKRCLRLFDGAHDKQSVTLISQ